MNSTTGTKEYSPLLLVSAMIILAVSIAGALSRVGSWTIVQSLFMMGIAWGSAVLLTPFVIGISFRTGWLDRPVGRKDHGRATPLLGGMALIGAFGLALLVNNQYSLQMKGIGISGLLMWLVGAIDDKHPLPASLRLVLQIAAVGILIGFGVRISFLPDTPLGFAGEVALTVIWVVGIANSLNYLDGMDGLAAGLGAIISFFLALAALQTGQGYFALIAAALFGSCLGFLPYNFRRKRNAAIFLGDGGAFFLGYTLAATAILGDWANRELVSLAVPVLLMGVPIFDMLLTTVMRIYNGQVKSVGQWLAFAGRDHFHHRLAGLGIGRYASVLVIWGVSILLGISAIVLKEARGLDAILLLIQAGMIFFLISFFMIYVRSHQIRLLTSPRDGNEASLTAEEIDTVLTSADKPNESQ